MRSPFAIFRKHQKLMTVVLTGLAMFAFVILGAVNDPSNMPPALIVIFVACMFGGVGWLLGIRGKKSSEFGFAGLILGTAVSVGAMLAVGEPVRVKADTGNLSEREFDFLGYQRASANQFMVQAVRLVQQRNESQFFQQPPLFGFGHPDEERDLVIGELLRREANELGIVVSDGMVNDYLRAVTQDKLSAPDVREIRNQMGLSESDLYNILKSEIQARLAAQYLYGGNTLPPESYWEFYEQMNVRQSVSIVPLPVREFVDESAEPSDSELQELFGTYRERFPNLGADGRLQEGQPGFRQPRKVRLAYVEAVYAPIEDTVEPPTDEEVEAYYDEHYKPIPPEALEPDADEGSSEGASDSSDSPQGESTEGSTVPPAAPDEEPPAEETDAEELPQGETNTEDRPPDEAPDASESEEGALLLAPSERHFVALLQDDEVTDAAQETAAPDPENAADVSDAGGISDIAQSPADDNVADGPPDASAADRPPPPPMAQPIDEATSPEAPPVRELDDDLRKEIRAQILRERTEQKQQQVIDDANDFVRELELKRADLQDEALDNSPDEPDETMQAQVLREASEQVLAELKAYADKHGLTYAETPLLSAMELRRSEDYPIGTAVDRLFSDPFSRSPVTSVVEQVFQSEPREVFLSRPVVHPETDSRFVYWKIEDQREFVPESLSDPGLREQVTAAWRERQARDKALARAAELAQTAEGKDTPLSEVFAGETVTGEPGAASITVLQPPRFSWMSKADPRMSPNPWSTPPPQRTQLRSVPGLIGDSFMKTVFDDTKEGEVSVAHSIDKEYYYVVRVDERSFGTAENWQTFRERFMTQPLFAPYYASDYPKLAQSKLQSYQTDWSEQLFKKHDVEIIDLHQQQDSSDTSRRPAY